MCNEYFAISAGNEVLEKKGLFWARPVTMPDTFDYDDLGRLMANVNAGLGGWTLERSELNRGYQTDMTTAEGRALTFTVEPQPDGGGLTYGYDGFLLKGQTWTGEISGSVTQSYNNDFLVSQRCVNASNCISFGYDNDNMLTSAGSLSITRDPQRAGLIVDTALSNVVTSNGYNLFGELESFDAEYLNTQYFHTQYIRDRLGRIARKTEVIEGETVTEIYGYDQAGRLETVNRNGTVTTYAYDPNGNRLSKTTGTEVESGTYDDQDRLTGYNGCSYQYTDNGELRTKTCGSEVTTYEYDVLGNLIAVSFTPSLAGEGGGEEITQIEYVIDGQNRRIGKKINGVLVQGFLYADQLNPIAELNADGSIRSQFVYGAKINVPDYMIRDGVTYRIISDHLGGPRLVINTADGSIVRQMGYDEFGNITLDTNPGFQPFGFAGGLYDSDTELVRFGARDYSAEIGRWFSKDPIGFDGGDTNLYGYVFNDPINFYDLYGLSGKPEKVPGTNSTVRIDKPHIPGQQEHVHIETKGKPEVVVNKDGTPSHGSDLKKMSKNKKLLDFLRRKGFNLSPYGLLPDPFELMDAYCNENPYADGCIPVPYCPDA